ncbi:MAG: sigma-54 dependent transcriptional regulator [Gemmatimonadota bacterium]|nr:sigma-54-dependent Fis family transcriptional regulator [Gemmatimonadota bacterium]
MANQLVDAEVKSSISVLVVDDEHTLRESCAGLLRAEGYQVEMCGRGDDAQELLRRRPFDLVLLDLYMSQVPGMEILGSALEANPDSIVIVMTGNPSVESSIEALRAGAWDYIPKPFSATHLQILMGRAAHAVTVARESRAGQSDPLKAVGPEGKITLLGVSAAFQRVVELARKVARTDASVFITGESGSGKEVIAQFIHHNSRRSSREMIPLNCAALPETLLESEMFGHVEGAFTGAVKEKIGLLEAANGGTLFLDELTEMPLPIQAKLLRVIQDGVVRRLGSTSTDAVVNVRFLAGTNEDPMGAVEKGKLRRDLYYRLRVVPIHIPPLRERPEDIPVLAEHFLKQFWKQHRGANEEAPRLTDEAIDALLDCPWRGNVRELRNVMEHSVVLLQPGVDIQADQIPFIDRAEGGEVSTGGNLLREVPLNQDYHTAREQVLAEFEKSYLQRIVRTARGNMSDAARIAGVDRTTLYRLMQKHGLDRHDLLTRGD